MTSVTPQPSVPEKAAIRNENTRNISEAARGSSEIAENIIAVATAAKNTTQGAENTKTAAGELSHMAAQVEQLISQFKFEDGNGKTTPPAVLGKDRHAIRKLAAAGAA